MSKPKVRARVEVLIKHRERGMIASSLSDRERVLSKLRHSLDNAEGKPAEQVMLCAADLLGKTQGMYRDLVETKVQRSAEEIRAELDEKLGALVGAEMAVH